MPRSKIDNGTVNTKNASVTSLTSEADLVVIGGGSAGLGAARAARRRGASVILVEQDRVGGDCTFTGCIPSKALLEHSLKQKSFPVTMASMRSAIEQVAERESPSILQREGITVVAGTASFVDHSSVSVDGRRLYGRRGIVIATGARPKTPSIVGLSDVSYLTSDSIFDLSRRPQSLAIIGGGPMGVELAFAFGRLGVHITLIERMERILPDEEAEASQLITQALQSMGITIETQCTICSVSQEGDQITIRLGDQREVLVEKLLLCVGREPDYSALNLARVGVAVGDNGFIVADQFLRTTASHIYVAGDVTSPRQLTPVAYRGGTIAGTNALLRAPLLRFRGTQVPMVTFGTPEVARVGLTEDQVASRGGRVAYLPMSEVDRAVTAGQTSGFIKIIAGPRGGLQHLGGGRILGATIVAERAGEMLSEILLMMRDPFGLLRLGVTMVAYPTWSTAVQQCAAQFFGGYGGRSPTPAAFGSSHS